MAPPSAVSAWLDRFFESYYRRRPVNATFIGVHDFDHLLPDISEHGQGDTIADMEHLLRDGDSLPLDSLTPAETLDHRLALGFLRTQLWEARSGHGPRGNPALHTGDAVFGLMSLFLTDFAPVHHRAAAAVERLEALPSFLTAAAAAVRRAPESWTARAIAECDGATAFLRDGIGSLITEHALEGTALRRAADRALGAVAQHRRHLERELSADSASPAAGAEALALQIDQSHFLDQDADDIVAHARAELDLATARLAALPGDTASPPVPAIDRYYHRYQEIWNEARSFAVEQRLLSWPDFPIRYRPRPLWSRSAAPFLYFLNYRSPAARGRPPVHEYLVPPVDDSLPRHEQAALLTANNEHVIRLNHVVHHGGIGHHVQNWHAFRAESRVGRIAAVDCASRIAMNCGGTMAEGWACYATDLMAEFGYLTPAERRDELATRRRMCARAIVDVELHEGRMSPDAAVAFYRKEAAMPDSGARAEVTKNGMFPGMALMYLVGTDAIGRLRSAVAARRGASFSLAGFHDEFLSFGSVPVALIAGRMNPASDPDQWR